MVLLPITIEAKPTKAQELEQTLVLLAQQVRQEPGCLSAHGYRDVEQDHSFCFVEAWATQADEYTYMQSEDWRILRGAMKLLGVTGKVQFGTVTETHEEQLVETPAQVRGQ